MPQALQDGKSQSSLEPYPFSVVLCQLLQTTDPDKERGAGDWQHYQSPKDVLLQVAARKGSVALPPAPGQPAAAMPQQVLSRLSSKMHRLTPT